MKTRILSLVCLFFLWTSCREGSEKEITLFNGFTFVMDNTERLADRDSLAQVPYTKYFNNIGQAQIPLYRVIEGAGYHIYLGIPFHTTLGKLATLRATQPMADTVLDMQQSEAFFYRRFIKDSLYLTEYIRSLDSTSTLCIYAVCKDSVLAATMLSEEKLKARIIK